MGSASHPAISGDGRRVAFTSEAWNLSPQKCNSARGIFVRDLGRGTTRPASSGDGGNRYLGPTKGSSAPRRRLHHPPLRVTAVPGSPRVAPWWRGAAPRHVDDMTTYATNITPFAAPTRDRTGPVLATITGGVAGFLAIILIAAGAALFWVSENKTDADGYYTTATHKLLLADPRPDDRGPRRRSRRAGLGSSPRTPSATSASTPARPTPPSRSSSASPVHMTSTPTSSRSSTTRSPTVDFDPFTVDKTRRAGEGRPAMPAAQTFWAASSTDGRALDWKVRSGNWSVVMMNADGSPGVSVDAAVGANAPLVRDLAWWLTIPGRRARPDRAGPHRRRHPRDHARRRAARRRRGARRRVGTGRTGGPCRGPLRLLI